MRAWAYIPFIVLGILCIAGFIFMGSDFSVLLFGAIILSLLKLIGLR